MATIPESKPRPVVDMSRLVAAAFAVNTALVAIPGLRDVPYFFTVIAVISAFLTGLALYFGVKVESKTVPYADVLSYVDKDRDVVDGPADDALAALHAELPDETSAPASGLDDYDPGQRDSTGVPRL